MEGVTTAVASIMDIVGEVVTTITGTPILMIFLASAIVGIGVGVFKKLKGN